LESGKGLADVRIVVDWELCDGQGSCAAIAPEIFEVTVADQVHVRQPEPPEAERGLVAEAVRSCPKAALRLGESS
jgi:ferredoxin